MLSEQELDEIKRYVLRELPRVLEQDPQFVLFIEGIISEKFPRRDEFARLLEEFTSFRQEQRESFQRVDQRFEQIDRRFEAIDRRFEQMNQRLEKVEQRLGELSQEMRDLRDWVELIAGRLRTRVGRSLEDIVAGALRLGLQRPDIDPQNVKLRQRISDPTGLVFKAGKQKEADLIARDGELLVFEVKSAPDVDDVDELADKTELVRLQNPDKRVTGILIAVGAEADVRQRCQEREVLLIP
ncbi:MAG: hypothetical protein N0A15_10625 [Anaerolineae bacterium]|nr:hypothetical protein [Anaerolineae bacterium]